MRGHDEPRSAAVAGSILLAQLCVLIVAGAAVAAYFYAEGRQEIFGGRAEILYEGQQVSLATEAERQIATQRALLESASTLGPVAERFGLAPDDLDEDVSVESVGDSNVLRAHSQQCRSGSRRRRRSGGCGDLHRPSSACRVT